MSEVWDRMEFKGFIERDKIKAPVILGSGGALLVCY